MTAMFPSMAAVPEPQRTWWILGALLGYVLMMAANPVRRNLADGVGCLRRYPELWAIVAVLGLGYAVWQLGVEVFFHYALPEGQKPVFLWSRAFFLPGVLQKEILIRSLLSAVEGVAGIFNNLVVTFPLSALAALLLLSNWEGHRAVLGRALWRRFGTLGALMHALVLVCAVAAVAKPALYVALPMLGQTSGLELLQLSVIIDALSFLFEYLFGVCIQIYLILLAFVWVRGRTFTHDHLLDFALRRFSVVMQWTALVMILSTLLIHVPQILSAYPVPARWLHRTLPADFVDHWVRPALALLLILFFTVQITLTFHSESLREALRDHVRFVRGNGWKCGWFLLIAFAHFYLLTVCDRFIVEGVGGGTALGIGWRLAYPIGAGVVAAWLLASWVSLFKACETGESHFERMTGR